MPTELSEGKSTKAAPAVPAVPLLSPLEEVTTPGTLPVACANCDTPLTGPFCAQCGQHVADYHRSVWRLVASFFDNVFSWDSKVFRTLGPLLTKPGLLTQDFMAGRRVRYVHPLRLFLFTSAVCLTLLQLGLHTTPMAITTDGNNKKVEKLEEIHFDFDEDEDASAAKTSPSPSPADPATVPPGAGAVPSPAATTAISPLPTVSPTPGGSLRHAARDHSKDSAPERYFRDLGERVKNKQKAIGQAELNRQISQDVQKALSWVALAMLPIFALLLRTFYWRRDSFYFVHLIFSLHYHTFLLLFWTAYKALAVVVKATHVGFLEFVIALCLLVPPWYLYRSLRRLFGESRRRTGCKVLALGALHLLALLLGVAIAGMTSLFSVV